MATTVKTSGTLPYDIKNAKSIFEYSKGLLGKTLRDYVWEGYEPKKGKGGLGQMVENIFFLLETNNYAGADFSEAGMELKCTPLKKSKQDEFLIKERLVCNMINLGNINHLYATNAQQKIPRTPLLCASRSYTSWLNRQIVFSLSRILANEWNGEFLLNSECTHVRCQGHSLMYGASAPS